ncbi:L,D-transpeptidase [Streptomyces sp. NPDC093060]|uniref:L,D-transpeptidase n=1 Tax=Streptomyces sp. NPDC093060 TaxID=3366019 RepID=UPI003825D638
MSDDRDYDADLHPELSGALRTLADGHQSPPPVAGAEIRRLAVRRGRRRRTTVVVGGVAAAAALAVTVTVGLGHDSDSGRRTTPAASPLLRTSPAPSPTPVPADAVVDLTGMTMTLDGRMMPISSGVAERPTPTGRFTVVAKSLKRQMEIGSGGGGGTSMPSVPWVIELRSADPKRTTAVIALTYDLKAPGNYASTGGWIGLPEADAKWVYARLDKGAVVLVTGRTPSPGASASTPS